VFGIGSVGGGEIVVILLIALLLFGPRRIPEIGRTVGKTLTQLRRATQDFKTGLEREIEVEKLKELKDLGGQVRAATRGDVGALARRLIESATPPAAPGPAADARQEPSDDGKSGPV